MKLEGKARRAHSRRLRALGTTKEKKSRYIRHYSNSFQPLSNTGQAQIPPTSAIHSTQIARPKHDHAGTKLRPPASMRAVKPLHWRYSSSCPSPAQIRQIQIHQMSQWSYLTESSQLKQLRKSRQRRTPTHRPAANRFWDCSSQLVLG